MKRLSIRIPSLIHRTGAGILLLSLTIGCRPPTPPADPHGHGTEAHADEEDSVHFPITVWTNGFEIFAEHPPVVAGHPAEFITHITHLATGQPRREGAITFEGRNAAGDRFTHPQAGPAREGIYLPRITFPKAGDWTVMVRIPIPDGTVDIPFPPVTVHADAPAAASAEPPKEMEGIGFLKEQQWQFPILIATAGLRDLVQRLTLPAVVEAHPGHRAAVTTPVSGRLLPPAGADTFPDLGQTVRPGQVMARIQPLFSDTVSRLIQARLAVREAEIHTEDARKTHDRIHQLAALQAKSPRELQAAETALQLAEAELESARRKAQAYTSSPGADPSTHQDSPVVSLTAPIPGVLVKWNDLGIGEFLPEGTPLGWILNPDPARIRADAPESLVPQLNHLTGADAEWPGGMGEPIPVWNESRGRLINIGLEVDEASRTLPVHVETPNPAGRFRIGQRLTLHLHTGQSRQALAIHASAIIEEEGLQTAYVQVAGETFEKRTVRLGIRDGDWVEVLDGIAAGEQVVIQNAQAIRLAAVAGGAVPHGHHH